VSEHILLLDGLWMRGFMLLPLKRRLAAAGYVVHIGDYASVTRGVDDSATRLAERARRWRAPLLHLVGHSLGGLVALKMLRQAPDLRFGKVICLGTPLRGSAAARGLASFPGGRSFLGKNHAMLQQGLAEWRSPYPLGMVAGRVPVGIGALLAPITLPHDGTVSLAETELSGLTDHCIVASTHTGLVFSRQVAGQIIAFLQNTRFTHD
jgi:pimeloyl-ACP methyl ester carboxylesterase